MSTVYLAHDPHFDRDVAVKLLPQELLNRGNLRRRFDREAKIVASLDHPAIVPVYDFGEQDGLPFLVMRFMAGGSLADRLIQGPLSIQEASRLLAHLAPALDEVHEKGVVHRDLKPSNILFDQRNEPFISDFGTATFTFAHTKLTETGGAVGTPAYMSPEQIQGQMALNGRSDIYSLGVILFEMLAGQHPFQTNTPIGLAVKHIFEPIPSIQAMQPDLPAGSQEIITKAMAKEVQDRYQTAVELANCLQILAGENKEDSQTVVNGGQTAVPQSRQFALIIHTDQYEDDLLSQLAAPTANINQLADLLHDPGIGGYDEVVCAINESGEELRRIISRFFAEKKADDLLLLYFSGHIAVDSKGQMYFAARTTDHNLLRATSVSGVFLADEMDNSHAQKQLLILDCFFSKVLLSDKHPTHHVPGVVGKAINTGAMFSRNGRARFILSASDSIHYVWQGNGVSGQPGVSRFSEYFVDGLQNGVTDRDNSDDITLQEMYHYIKERTHSDANQTSSARHIPRVWVDNENTQLILAKNPRLSQSEIRVKQNGANQDQRPISLSSAKQAEAKKRPRWYWAVGFCLLIGFLLLLGSGPKAENGRSTLFAAAAPSQSPTSLPPTATPTKKPTSQPTRNNRLVLPTTKPSLTPLPQSTRELTMTTVATRADKQSSVATALLPSSIFALPDTSATERAILETGDEVTVLGRSLTGNWFYVLNQEAVAGFVFGERLAWTGDFDALPQVPAAANNEAAQENCAGSACPRLRLDLYPLPGYRCEGGVSYRTVYMHGQGGNGRYTYYWNNKKMAGPLSEGFGFEVNNLAGDPVIGMGKVVSGDGQTAEKELFVSDFGCN